MCSFSASLYSQNIKAIYADTVYTEDYHRVKQLHIFDDSTFSYQERSFFYGQLSCIHQINGAFFKIKGVYYSDKGTLILSGSSITDFNNQTDSYSIYNLKLKKRANKIKVKVYSKNRLKGYRIKSRLLKVKVPVLPDSY